MVTRGFRDATAGRLRVGFEERQAKMEGNGEERDALTRLVLKLDAKLDLIDEKLDLSRAGAHARIDALRLELLDDLRTVLRIKAGFRKKFIRGV